MIEWKRLPSNKELWDIAVGRERMHENDNSYRTQTDNRFDGNFIGLIGERKWAYLTGTDMDLERRRCGDGGKDTWLDMKDGTRNKGDIKTARFPKDLICGVQYIKDNTIYILGKLTNWRDAYGNPLPRSGWDADILKWNYDTELRKSEPKYHKEGGILNYWIPFHQNPDIDELLAKVERRWGRGA